MTNFLPLKKSILFYLDELINQYGLQPDFLDVGCGIGDVSRFLAERGWRGKAIDISGNALEKAQENLAAFPGVNLEKLDFFDATGTYKTVFLLDFLEHIPTDKKALQKLVSLIADGGHAVIVVPSNPRFWHWDDDFYGHIRRYTEKGIKKKLEDVGLKTVAIWDFTFPVFSLMRRIYATVFRNPKKDDSEKTIQHRTMQSGIKPRWQDNIWINSLGKLPFFWDLVHQIQFRFFKHQTRWGHEMIILAKKDGDSTAHERN